MMWKMGCLKWITSGVPENSRRSAIISSKSSLRHSTCTFVRGKPSSSAPFCCSGSSSLRNRMPTTSLSPTMPPRALTARASGVSRSWETTMGGPSMPRTLRMKSELVPLPAPGAPPSRINSLGKRIRLRPNSPSSSRQTAPKMSCASLTSSSGEFVAAGTRGAAIPGPFDVPALSPCIWVRFMRRSSNSNCHLQLTQQLTKDKGQDASVPVVIHLDGRIDAKLDRLLTNGTVLSRDVQSDILTWRDTIGESKHVEDFRAHDAQSLSGDAVRELERKDAHPDKIRAVDALEALGNNDFHPEKASALGGPITAGAGPIFLAGEDDEWNPIGLVGHASVINESRLTLFGLDLLVRCVNLPFAEVKGVSAFDAGNYQVFDADVREGAAGHNA